MGGGCGTVSEVIPIVVVEGAVFEDGVSEGDPEAIAPIAAELIAARMQSRRIRELVGHILADTSAGDSTKLVRIRAGLQSLPDKPDREILDAIRRPLRGLRPGMQNLAQFHASLGLREPKRRALAAVDDFDRSSRSGTAAKSLGEWWAEWSRSM